MQFQCARWANGPIGKFPFDKLLTYYEFDEFHKAMQDVKDGRTIKPVLINRGPSSTSSKAVDDE
jgi:hypothetical protein